jgi:hypothetical protein
MHDVGRCLSLGNQGPPTLLARLREALHLVPEPKRQPVAADPGVQETGFLVDGVFVFVAQLAAMTLFAVLFMHIQVCSAKQVLLTRHADEQSASGHKRAIACGILMSIMHFSIRKTAGNCEMKM